MFVNWVWEFQILVCDNRVWKSSCILINETYQSPLHDLYVDISYKFTLAWLYVLYVSHACTQITMYTCLVSGIWYISYIIFHDDFHNSHEHPIATCNSYFNDHVCILLLQTRRWSNSIPWCIFPEASHNYRSHGRFHREIRSFCRQCFFSVVFQ